MTKRFLITVLATLGTGCGEAPPDSAPAETPPTEGVFGMAPPAVSGIPSVITLHGSPPPDAWIPTEPPVLDQLGLAFSPRNLLVRVGERVVFSNSETLTHNVHLTLADTGVTILNADSNPAGRMDFVFDREGGYDVSCDEHPGMSAFIFATTTPHAAFADADGRFVLTGVPPGTYTLSVWSIDPHLRSQRTVQVSGSSTEVPLSTTSR